MFVIKHGEGIMIDLVKNLATINRRTKSSVIRELLSLTNKPGMISFAGGLPDPKAFPAEIIADITNDILKKQSKTALQYGPTDGLPELKQEIANLIRKDEGINITPDNLLITTASQQGLDLVGRLFIDPTNPVLVELPSYIGGLQSFKAYGANLIGVKCDDDGVLVDDLEVKLQKLLKEEEHYKFIYLIPDFQNPSGVTLNTQRRKQVLKLAEQYNVFLVEDAPYRQIRFEGKAPEMLFKLNGAPSNVISLFTFSKTFVPGLRLGYVVAHDAVIKKMSTLKQSMDLCTAPIVQMIAAEFLKRDYFHDHVKKTNAIYKAKKDVMLDALERYMPKEDGISWTKPEGGLFLWFRLPKHVSADDMFFKAVDKKVAYVIGSAFHCDGSGQNTMRLNFSYPTHDEIDEGIKRLAEVVKEALVKK